MSYLCGMIYTHKEQITLDLHGKKVEKSTEEETYDVSDMANEEQPVAVEEHTDDPDLSVPTYTEQVTEDGLRVLNPTGKSVVVNPPVAEETPQPSQTEQPVTSQELNEENEYTKGSSHQIVTWDSSTLTIAILTKTRT